MKTLTIKAVTSCDEQFIERVALSDPFDYWNMCIVPNTAREIFPVPQIKQERILTENFEGIKTDYQVSCTIHKLEPNIGYFTHQLVYTILVDTYVNAIQLTHQTVAEAIIMYFGIIACTVTIE